MRQCQELVIEYIRENPNTLHRDIYNAIPEYAKRTIRNSLTNLRRRGLIESRRLLGDARMMISKATDAGMQPDALSLKLSQREVAENLNRLRLRKEERERQEKVMLGVPS